MKKKTLAIDTPFQKSDAYGALSMPVYHTLAYEFADADVMSDAFCGRIEEARLLACEACFRFINKLKLVHRATNLFDNHTLAIHPASTIFGPFTDEQRAAMDVLDTTIRISVGLEDMDDIVEDFRQAL